MAARAEYQKALETLGSEEEDDLEVFDEEMADENEEAMDEDSPPEDTGSTGLDKGKGRALAEDIPSSKRKRHRMDAAPASGSKPRITNRTKKAKLSAPVHDDSPQGVSISTVEARGGKKAKHKSKKL